MCGALALATFYMAFCYYFTGSTTYTCILNNRGGIESDLTVSAVDDDGPQTLLGVPGKVNRISEENFPPMRHPSKESILCMYKNKPLDDNF